MVLLIKISEKLSGWFSWIAGGSLFLMMLLTCADVLLRFFGHPILGTFDIVSFLGIFIVAFSLAYTQLNKGHVAIEYIVGRLPSRSQSVAKTLTYLISTTFFAVLCWESFIFANDLRMSGEVSATAEIPVFPFGYSLAVACFSITLVLFVDFLKSIKQAAQK